LATRLLLPVDTIFGGSGDPYFFSVDGGVRLSPGEFIPVSGGLHLISYFDGQECEIIDSLTITEPTQITVSFDPAVIEIELGDAVVLEPNIFGLPTGIPATLIWTPAELLVNPDTLYPTTRTFESATYTLTVADSNGCTGTGSVVVNVDPNRNVYIPNVFYPGNPDGTNTHFHPWIGLGVEKVNYFRVYDRWGDLMYGLDNFLPENQPSEGWDGRFRGKFVNPGVYVYVGEVKFVDGRVLIYRGDVTVMR
jgi:hypothetical protein